MYDNNIGVQPEYHQIREALIVMCNSLTFKYVNITECTT